MGHTALAHKQYTASAYLARILGQLGRDGDVFYHPGIGTGRWSYNTDISYWSVDADAVWEKRVTWVSVIGDDSPAAQQDDATCRSYVEAP